MENLLEFKNVSLKLRKFQLKDISFSLKEGSIMGLIGENGAGKTTALKLIFNALTKSSGKIEVLRKDNEKNEVFVKNVIGYVPAESYLLDNKTIGEHRGTFNKFYDNWDKEKCSKYLKKYGVPNNEKCCRLSTGMKKKAMMALAFAHNPRILVLDEPTSGLDPVARTEMLEDIRDYALEGNAVIIASHITTDLDKIADYITLIHKGEILLSDSIDDIQENFVLVKGDLKDIGYEERFIGIRKFERIFEGLILRKELGELSVNANISIPNVEELFSYYIWGDR